MIPDDVPASFEGYAAKRGCYHPMLLRTVGALYRADPQFFSGLFSSNRDLGLLHRVSQAVSAEVCGILSRCAIPSRTATVDR
jgi:hypothetical protein